MVFVFPVGFCHLLGMLPGTGNFTSGIALQNFSSLSFFALVVLSAAMQHLVTLGLCYSSSLPFSSLKVPAICSCYNKKSGEVEVTIFILVDFYVAKHR